MRVLVACEHSGVVREAFSALGYDAWSCDILPSLRPGKHIQADALTVINDGWDLMIAHPPCTYLSDAGRRHWNAPGRAEKREEALQFFMALYNAPIPFVCVENPKGYVSSAFRRPDQTIHPYMFGDRFYKRTCLWLRGLPPLLWFESANVFGAPVAAARPEPHSVGSTGKKRHWVDGAKRDPLQRSVTSPGIAEAMAAQWGEFVSLGY